MEIYDTKIEVIKGDITELATDAIVNAANNQLIMGGGVAGAIKRRGGSSIQEEAKKISPIKKGEAAITNGGNLKTKYVIHAATMGMDFKTDQNIIRQATRNTLLRTKDMKINSLAFPALGCGVGGFLPDEAAKIMLEEVITYTKMNNNLNKIIFVLYNEETYSVFKKVFEERFSRMKKKIEECPMSTVDIIIEKDDEIILIERENPPFGWALPGGFVETGETVEEAASREAEEETGVKLKELKQFHVYSDPGRDPRFHSISCVFTAKTLSQPKASSDAKEAKFFSRKKLPPDIVFDHKQILEDYFKFKGK